MKRFFALVRADFKMLARNGFLVAAAAVVVIWSTALHFLPAASSDTWVPVALWLDMAIVGFFFIGAVVLQEKNQRIMAALIVTPLRFAEYLGSKILLLTLLALCGCAIVVLWSRGLNFNPLWLLIGVSMTAVVTLLYGFATVMPFNAMSTYTIPANIYLGVLQAALIPHFGWSDWFVLKLLPTFGALQLIQAAFTPISFGHAVFGFASAAIWIVLLSLLCLRMHRRYALVRGREQ